MAETTVGAHRLQRGLLLRVATLADSSRLVEEAALAESDGLDVVWIEPGSESAASVLPMAAAVANATERIRIGVAAMPGSTLHPLRLAEDLAMIDVASDGRLDWIGDDLDGRPSPGHWIEGVEIVLRAWRGRPFEHDGPHWSFPEVACVPTPASAPHPPVWVRAGVPWGEGMGDVRVGTWCADPSDAETQRGAGPRARVTHFADDPHHRGREAPGRLADDGLAGEPADVDRANRDAPVPATLVVRHVVTADAGRNAEARRRLAVWPD